MFFHVLAVMHAPAYAVENAGALRQDWPRVPVGLGTPSPTVFHAGARSHPSGRSSLQGEPSPERGASVAEDTTREWLLRGAAVGRRVPALLDIETLVLGVDAGDVPPELRSVGRYAMADGPAPRERTEDVVLWAGW